MIEIFFKKDSIDKLLRIYIFIMKFTVGEESLGSKAIKASQIVKSGSCIGKLKLLTKRPAGELTADQLE